MFRCIRKKNNSKTQAEIDQLKQTLLFKISLFYLFTCFLPLSLSFISLKIIFIFLTSAFSGTQVRIVRTGSYAPSSDSKPKDKILELSEIIRL